MFRCFFNIQKMATRSVVGNTLSKNFIHNSSNYKSQNASNELNQSKFTPRVWPNKERVEKPTTDKIGDSAFVFDPDSVSLKIKFLHIISILKYSGGAFIVGVGFIVSYIHYVKDDLKDDIKDLKDDLKDDIKDLKDDIKDLKDTKELKEFKELKNSTEFIEFQKYKKSKESIILVESKTPKSYFSCIPYCN